MPRFDAETAQCTVFTYKEGLLSPIGHDLKIAVTRFTVIVTATGEGSYSLQAEFDAASLRVQSAMRDEKEAPQLLGESDRRKIEHNIATDVLAAARHPQIAFSAAGIKPTATTIVGQLTLHGRSREQRVTVRPIADRYVAEATLHQPDYGIKPYSALLGTLRIKPDLLVRVSLPRIAAEPA